MWKALKFILLLGYSQFADVIRALNSCCFCGCVLKSKRTTNRVRLSTTLCVYRSSVRFGLVRSARLSGRITMAIVNRVTGGFGQGVGRTKQEEACGSARSRAMQSANLTLLFLLLLFFFYIL